LTAQSLSLPEVFPKESVLYLVFGQKREIPGGAKKNVPNIRRHYSPEQLKRISAKACV